MRYVLIGHDGFVHAGRPSERALICDHRFKVKRGQFAMSEDKGDITCPDCSAHAEPLDGHALRQVWKAKHPDCARFGCSPGIRFGLQSGSLPLGTHCGLCGCLLTPVEPDPDRVAEGLARREAVFARDQELRALDKALAKKNSEVIRSETNRKIRKITDHGSASEAWIVGYRSRVLLGAPVGNPHDERLPQHALWQSGYETAESDLGV